MASTSLKGIIVASLDDLSFSHSSLARRSRALDALERVLANICVSHGEASSTEAEAFMKLQDGFEGNVASRLMYCISVCVLNLQKSITAAIIEDPADLEALSTSRIISQSLSILQGMALLHSPSKKFLGKKWCIQTFLNLLTMSRYPMAMPLSTSTNTISSISAAPSGAVTLALNAIDTLLCVLVDSPPALRAFEEADGVAVVVKTLKRTGVARDIRIKCLEFLYFYLLDETEEVTSTIGTSHKTPPIPHESRVATHTPSALGATPSTSRSPSPDSSPRSPHKIPKNLRMLRRDVDFVPITPQKTQVSRLGMGTPRTGSGRTQHNAVSPMKLGRTSPIDICVTPASPTNRQLAAETSFCQPRPGVSQGDCRRSTQEKKEILGSLLGNVEALVEGVAKSGIWGLG